MNSKLPDELGGATPPGGNPGSKISAGEAAPVDSALRQKLRQYPVPADLRDSLLGEVRTVRPNVPAWRWRGLRVAAAALFLAVAGWFFLDGVFVRPVAATEFQREMVAMLDAGVTLDHVAPAYAEVKSWLLTEHQVHNLPVPEAWTTLPTVGCRVWRWRGREVKLICFAVSPGQTGHCFIVDDRGFKGAPGLVRIMGQQGRWATATWVNEGRMVFLADPRNRESLEKGLTSASRAG